MSEIESDCNALLEIAPNIALDNKICRKYLFQTTRLKDRTLHHLTSKIRLTWGRRETACRKPHKMPNAMALVQRKSL